MSNWLRDFRYALRRLVKNPGFASIATVILALGIGANTAVFSVVSALLFHPYPFPHLDELMLVRETGSAASGAASEGRMAAGDLFALRQEGHTFHSLAAYKPVSVNLADNGGLEGAEAVAISANFFDVLGVRPARGRSLAVDEDQPGRDSVLIISDGFWKQRYAADPHLLGQQVRVNGRRFTLIGIMPPHSYPVGVDVWVPLVLSPDEKRDKSTLSLYVVGRLNPGISSQQALTELTTLARRWQREFPKTNLGRSINVLPLRREQYEYTAPTFLMLQVAALFVLLLASANLLNLLLARFLARRKELAIRLALGANGKGVTQVLLAEVLLLAFVAGTLAMLVSFWTVSLVRASIPAAITKWIAGWDGIQVNTWVLGFALLITALMGAILGIGTALRSARVDPNETLKQGGAIVAGRSSKPRLANALIIVQVVFAMVLLVGAVLMMRGFLHLVNVYAGFQPTHILSLQVSLPEKKYPLDLGIQAFYDQLLRGTKFLPGLETAALGQNIPASNVGNESVALSVQGQPRAQTAPMLDADQESVSPDFFRVFRIPFLQGRCFSDHDDRDAPPVAMISQTMAAHFWPGQNPIGRRVKLGEADSNSPWITIIGTVGDVKQNWFDPRPRPTLYLPQGQVPKRSMYVVVRSLSDPSAMAGAIRNLVEQIDPEIGVSEIQRMDGVIRDSISPVRLMGILLCLFGSIALALSAVGLYGVLAQAVAQRTSEFGLRMALGAKPGELVRLVLRQSLRLCAIGLAIALPLSVALGQLMSNLLFGVVALNAATLAALVGLLISVGLFAALVPARRAMSVDPLVALRYE